MQTPWRHLHVALYCALVIILVQQLLPLQNHQLGVPVWVKVVPALIVLVILCVAIVSCLACLLITWRRNSMASYRYASQLPRPCHERVEEGNSGGGQVFMLLGHC